MGWYSWKCDAWFRVTCWNNWILERFKNFSNKISAIAVIAIKAIIFSAVHVNNSFDRGLNYCSGFAPFLVAAGFPRRSARIWWDFGVRNPAHTDILLKLFSYLVILHMPHIPPRGNVVWNKVIARFMRKFEFFDWKDISEISFN